MDSQRLVEIRKNLSALPVLQERLEKLEKRISEAEEEMEALLRKYNEESLDVEQLKKDSLSNTIYKLFKKYEGKLEKETEEMLKAKMEYDKATDRVLSLNAEREELKSRISALLDSQKTYEAELKSREEAIKRSISSEAFAKYKELEAEQEELSRQLVELDEAIAAANSAKRTAEDAKEHLDKAEGWATFDIWGGRGILSHMMKYDHIDEAEAAFNKLSSQLRDLNKELSDVGLLVNFEGVGIDSTTRMFDFWFDNIFTDINVRNKILDDLDMIADLRYRLDEIIKKLEKNKLEIQIKIDDVENRKDDLLISINDVK